MDNCHNHASADSLCTLMQEVTRVQASQYFGTDDVRQFATSGSPRVGQVLKRYIAMVLLSSQELRIVLKVHFNPEQIHALRRSRGCQEADLSDKHLIDFMKELSNQMGGRVCRVFDAHGISMGMSVPLCTRGIYEIYADYTPKSGAIDKFGALWGLEGPFGTLYCSSYVELISKQDYAHMRYTDEVSQEGELDFL